MGTFSELNPDFYEQAVRGNGFLYHTPGQALLLSATTGTVPTVHNPIGSGKNFVPLAIRLSFLSGTTTIGGVLIGRVAGAGSQPATGSPIATGTHVDPVNAYSGGPSAKASVMRWYPTTNTFTTAGPTLIAATGINLGTAAPSVPGPYECRLDGSLIFAPGTAMSILYSVTTSTSLWFCTIFGIEVPIPPQPGN